MTSVARFLCCLAAALLLAAAVSAQDGAQDGAPERDVASGDEPETASGPSVKKLRVGVRSYARPFSYRSNSMADVLTAVTPGPLARERYSGYIVKICDEVLTDMMLEARKGATLGWDAVDVVNIEEKMEGLETLSDVDRFSLLRPVPPGSDAPEPQIDILCDPATITNERRTGLIISPPIYLTGISYITAPDMFRSPEVPEENGQCPLSAPGDPGRLVHHFGLVGTTTAASAGIRALLTTNEMPQYRDALNRFLRNDETNIEECPLSPRQRQYLDTLQEQGIISRGSVMLYPNHHLAAEAFCNGEVIYYVGDREIIMENARKIAGCDDFNAGDRTFTVDRYAIYGRIDYEDPDRALLVARFFEILSQKIVSHPSVIDQAFYDTFHPTSPTPTLDLFFRSVRGSPQQ